MGDVRIDKAQTRREMKAALARLTPQQARDGSAAVCQRLLNVDAYASARTILLYAPLTAGNAREVDITPVAEHALRTGRTVCVPRPDWESSAMSALQVKDWAADLVSDERRASIGLRRPRDDAAEVDPTLLDLVVVPGLAFDLSGHRLGRGAGFYDRFLARLRGAARGSTRCPAFGVAFDEQILGPGRLLDRDPWDMPVDAVVTPTRLVGLSESGWRGSGQRAD